MVARKSKLARQKRCALVNWFAVATSIREARAVDRRVNVYNPQTSHCLSIELAKNFSKQADNGMKLSEDKNEKEQPMTCIQHIEKRKRKILLAANCQEILLKFRNRGKNRNFCFSNNCSDKARQLSQAPSSVKVRYLATQHIHCTESRLVSRQVSKTRLQQNQ